MKRSPTYNEAACTRRLGSMVTSRQPATKLPVLHIAKVAIAVRLRATDSNVGYRI